MDYRALDYTDFKRARELEAEAETLVPPIRGVPRRTRGPLQEALREKVRKGPARETADSRASRLRAAALLAEADRHYWLVIERHGGLARKLAFETRKFAPVLRHDIDLLTLIVKEGFFRAALRFDYECGLVFPTYARSWGIQAVQAAPERQTVVAWGTGRKDRAHAGGWSFVGAVERVGLFDDEVQISTQSIPDPEETVENRRLLARLQRAIDNLEPGRVRDVMRARYKGTSLERIGANLKVSKEYARQLESVGLAQLRTEIRG